jgi:hypothetical protein
MTNRETLYGGPSKRPVKLMLGQENDQGKELV